MGFASVSFAQKVVKVKGNKVYFKKAGYAVKVGEELVVLSNGTDAASIEVLKVRRNIGLGRIVNGTVKPGYQVQLKRKESRRSRKGRRASREKSSKAKMYGYSGLGFFLLGDLELSDGSKFDFNNHMVIPVGFEVFFTSQLSGTLELIYAFSGGGNPTNLAGAEEWDTSYMEINGGLTYYFSRKFYGRGSLGWTMMNFSGSNTSGNPAENGNFDYDFSGLNLGLGGGMQILFSKNLNFKIDLGYKYNSFSSATLVKPLETTEGDPGLSQSNISLTFLTSIQF